MQAESTQESAGIALLRPQQPRHGLLKSFHVSWKDLVNQRPPLRGQLTEHHSLILGARPPADQSTRLELLHDIRRTRASHQNSVSDGAEREGTLVVQHFQDGELRQAQSGLSQMWP